MGLLRDPFLMCGVIMGGMRDRWLRGLEVGCDFALRLLKKSW